MSKTGSAATKCGDVPKADDEQVSSTHFSNKRPNSSMLSSTPARRRQCHAIAWLLEVTGFPISCSIPTACSTQSQTGTGYEDRVEISGSSHLGDALADGVGGDSRGDTVVFLVEGAKDGNLVSPLDDVVAHEVVDILAVGR